MKTKKIALISAACWALISCGQKPQEEKTSENVVAAEAVTEPSYNDAQCQDLYARTLANACESRVVGVGSTADPIEVAARKLRSESIHARCKPGPNIELAAQSMRADVLNSLTQSPSTPEGRAEVSRACEAMAANESSLSQVGARSPAARTTDPEIAATIAEMENMTDELSPEERAAYARSDGATDPSTADEASRDGPKPRMM